MSVRVRGVRVRGVRAIISVKVRGERCESERRVRPVTTEEEEEEEEDADAELKPRTPTQRCGGKNEHASILFQHLATSPLDLSDRGASYIV